MKKLLLGILLLVMACGSGGGGTNTAITGITTTTIPPSANYSGTWKFTGTLALDECQLNFARTLTNTLIVTHMDKNVSVLNNQLTLTGTITVSYTHLTLPTIYSV